MMKIAIVVHGRFHAFDLTRELINLGHKVTLFTNYPGYIVKKWGIPEEDVESFLLHGIVSRAVGELHKRLKFPALEAFLHRWFSIWAGRKIQKRDYDVVRVFSGVAEEVFRSVSDKYTLKILTRGSAHIRTQYELLAEEENRAGVPIEKPSRWRIKREMREYELADSIQVLSSFAKESFIAHGVPEEKLSLLLSSTQVKRFRPDKGVIKERCKRILSGEPLRILTVGRFSFRKGILDLCRTVSLTKDTFRFRSIGSIATEAKRIAQEHKDKIEFIPRQFEFELPGFYEWADIFILPTIEDSFPVVLAQAQAAGLPIISSTNCCGPDIIKEGETGWVLPVRRPDGLIERLIWCDLHRSYLLRMVQNIYEDFKPRDWADVARDFIDIAEGLLSKRKKQKASRRGLCS